MKTLGERANGLRWRVRATRRLWSRGATPQMPFLGPEPPPVATPEALEPEALEPEPRGAIDSPQPNMRVEAEAFTVFGWVAFPSGPPVRVEAWLGETPLGRARLGVPRSDLHASSDLPGASLAGFELPLDVNALPTSARRGEMHLRVVASGAHGERHELGPVAFSLVGRAPEARAKPPRTVPIGRHGGDGGRRALVVTHQLDLGGAQLYLMDLMSELRRQGVVEPTVVSAVDGSLREELEAMGILVHISGRPPLDDLSSHLGRVEELTAWARPHDFELALINTATTLASPGAEVAAALGIPALWAIHESFAPRVAWAGLEPGVLERIERALTEAAFAIFEAEATQRLYEPMIDPRRCLTLPYGLDLGPIDRARAEFDRDAAKREAGIPASSRVVLCVGAVEARKAQIPLAQAFAAIAERNPDAYLVFVGAGGDVYSEALEDFIEGSPWSRRMRLVATTRDVQPWFGMADLLVCCSDLESLPRTVLEAMAWETPVLATEVFGLPELIEPGKTGWLCEPRDISKLAEALDEALSAPAELRRAIGRNARELVELRHSLPHYAEEVSRLIEDAVKSSQGELKKKVSTG